ncbi:MAG: 50S ribosomal protein L2, partial [Rickettsiales bacterium]|nr:50S ribosomal protein L2 [Rickettsiales bacterium]
MALKKLNPTTAGQRGVVLVDRSELHKGSPYKKLTVGLPRTGGRNNKGHNTSINVGTRHKRLYRLIDFKRQKFGVAGTVERLEYDPNRTAFIALVGYTDGEKAYILAPQKLEIGQVIVADEKADIKPGNTMRLKNMPIGT